MPFSRLKWLTPRLVSLRGCGGEAERFHSLGFDEFVSVRGPDEFTRGPGRLLRVSGTVAFARGSDAFVRGVDGKFSDRLNSPEVFPRRSSLGEGIVFRDSVSGEAGLRL